LFDEALGNDRYGNPDAKKRIKGADKVQGSGHNIHAGYGMRGIVGIRSIQVLVLFKAKNNSVKENGNDEEGKGIIFLWYAELAIIGDKEKEKGSHKTSPGVHYLYRDNRAAQGAACYFNKITQSIEKYGKNAVYKQVTLFAPAALQGNNHHVDRERERGKNQTPYNCNSHVFPVKNKANGDCSNPRAEFCLRGFEQAAFKKQFWKVFT
jgi:hypothetical protein